MMVNYLRASDNKVQFQAGDIIFHEGETGDLAYSVIDGEVEIVHNGLVLDTVGADGIVGEMALVGEPVRSATLRAKTDCTLVPINQQKFLWLVHETPTFATQVMATMAQRLKHMNQIAQA